MKDEDKVVESFGKAMRAVLARLPPEEVLGAYTPGQLLLALPDEALRGLSREYLATLPRKTRTAIQRRLAAPAASPRTPARRRATRVRSR